MGGYFVQQELSAARRGGVPSTLTDRRAGRPLEADARNGAVARVGARHGIATPANARATELMRQIHRRPDVDAIPELAAALDGASVGSRRLRGRDRLR